MASSGRNDSLNLEEIDVDGWEERSPSDGEELRIVSDDRRDKIVIKEVSFSRDDIDVGYLIEYHQGDSPYARYRRQCGSVIAVDTDDIREKITELIDEHR